MTEISPFQTANQKQKDREAKRQAVLRAAVQIFNERGFHATLLEDVAISLGISKPTIYHYLGNKEQVLLQCVIHGLEQLLEAADSAKQQPGLGIDRLRNYLQRYAEINMDDFGRCVIRTGDEALSDEGREKFRALKRQIDLSMRALIDEGIADGSIAPCDSKLLAFTLAGALNWPARWFSPSGRQSKEEVAAQMVDLLTAGFAPR
ncbi:TetR/AcrR family transcriptional regulator [Stutzerimonas chloritidismutans]|uniref:TetR/AcrR family transcriptional regulator n=1 Tax=Stutzerimonas chloritidismutans TaxID=203192 RepID=UPI003F191340